MTSNEQNNEAETKGKPMTNAEFIHLIFFITTRLVIYTALTIVLLIFHQGKMIDPLGYTRLINAFTFTDQKKGINIASFIPLNEYFDKEYTGLEVDVPVRDKDATTRWMPLHKEIQAQRLELFKLTLQCFRLEESLDISDSECNKVHFSFHEAVLDKELELNSRPSHLILLKLMERIDDEFYRKAGPEDPSSDQADIYTFTDNTSSLLFNLQDAALTKLKTDHQTILSSTINKTSPSPFNIDAGIQECVNDRVFQLLTECPIPN